MKNQNTAARWVATITLEPGVTSSAFLKKLGTSIKGARLEAHLGGYLHEGAKKSDAFIDPAFDLLAPAHLPAEEVLEAVKRSGARVRNAGELLMLIRSQFGTYLSLRDHGVVDFGITQPGHRSLFRMKTPYVDQNYWITQLIASNGNLVYVSDQHSPLLSGHLYQMRGDQIIANSQSPLWSSSQFRYHPWLYSAYTYGIENRIGLECSVLHKGWVSDLNLPGAALGSGCAQQNGNPHYWQELIPYIVEPVRFISMTHSTPGNPVYLCSEHGGSSYLIANRPWSREWEQFYMVRSPFARDKVMLFNWRWELIQCPVYPSPANNTVPVVEVRAGSRIPSESVWFTISPTASAPGQGFPSVVLTGSDGRGLRLDGNRHVVSDTIAPEVFGMLH